MLLSWPWRRFAHSAIDLLANVPKAELTARKDFVMPQEEKEGQNDDRTDGTDAGLSREPTATADKQGR